MNSVSRAVALGALAATMLGAAAADKTGTAQAAELTVAVSGVTPGAGRVYISLHRAAAGVAFPDSRGVVAGVWRLAGAAAFSITLTGLEPGRYAVNGYHDANGNGKLDTNLLGVPTEGYGFGNGAVGAFGPPGFAAAAVDLVDKARIALPIGHSAQGTGSTGR